MNLVLELLILAIGGAMVLAAIGLVVFAIARIDKSHSAMTIPVTPPPVRT